MTYQSGRRRRRPRAESRGAGHRGRHLCRCTSPLGSVHGRRPQEAREAEEAPAARLLPRTRRHSVKGDRAVPPLTGAFAASHLWVPLGGCCRQQAPSGVLARVQLLPVCHWGGYTCVCVCVQGTPLPAPREPPRPHSPGPPHAPMTWVTHTSPCSPTCALDPVASSRPRASAVPPTPCRTIRLGWALPTATRSPLTCPACPRGGCSPLPVETGHVCAVTARHQPRSLGCEARPAAPHRGRDPVSALGLGHTVGVTGSHQSRPRGEPGGHQAPG